jgi:hypothetical protein
MSALAFVWVLVFTAGDSLGRSVGPFATPQECEQARQAVNTAGGRISSSGYCARVIREGSR